MSASTIADGLNCPLPIGEYDTIVLAHGGGGKLTHRLIDGVFKRHFSNPDLDRLHDGAVVDMGSGRIAMTTDGYVVSPIVFPGGTIGELAVNGTVNDLAMCGALPRYLTASFILEEGLLMTELDAVVASMAEAARKAGVAVVTGDTKVVPRGKADRLFITTSGVGVVPAGRVIGHERVAPGDAVILSGTIADHGMAVMSVREGLEFESEIRSDTAALNGLVEAMFAAAPDLRFLRDPTRGGVASTLNELAASARFGIVVDETAVPVDGVVRSACEILGFDPLYVANEGKLLAVTAAVDAEKVVAAMRAHPAGKDAAVIGRVTEAHPGVVVLRTAIGGERVVDMISGEQLPRIC